MCRTGMYSATSSVFCRECSVYLFFCCVCPTRFKAHLRERASSCAQQPSGLSGHPHATNAHIPLRHFTHAVQFFQMWGDKQCTRFRIRTVPICARSGLYVFEFCPFHLNLKLHILVGEICDLYLRYRKR